MHFSDVPHPLSGQKSDSQSTDSSSQMEVEEVPSEVENGQVQRSATEGKGVCSTQIDVDSGIENMEVDESKDSRLRVIFF